MALSEIPPQQLKCAKRWTPVEASGGPGGRHSHATAPISDCELLVLGGVNIERHMFNDAWIFNTKEWRWWELVIPLDQQRQPIGGPAMGGWHGHAITFGGYERDGLSDECWVLKIDPPAWRLLTPSGGSEVYSPGARYCHCGLVLMSSFCIFGGALDDTNLYRLDLTTSEWSICAAQGATPLAVSEGTMVHCHCDSFVLFGGCIIAEGGWHPSYLTGKLFHAQLRESDVAAMQVVWEEVAMRGVPVPPRDAHCMAALQSSTFVIFGGNDGRGSGPSANSNNEAYLLQLFKRDGMVMADASSVEAAEGVRPPSRNGFTMTGMVDADDMGIRFYVFGGGASQYATGEDISYDDTWVLDIDHMGQQREDLRDAAAGRVAAVTRKIVGILRLFAEDLVQGILQICFLLEFWAEMPGSSRAFTIASVLTGLLCSIGGPINEYRTELRQGREAKLLEGRLRQMRADAKERRELLTSAFHGAPRRRGSAARGRSFLKGAALKYQASFNNGNAQRRKGSKSSSTRKESDPEVLVGAPPGDHRHPEAPTAAAQYEDARELMEGSIVARALVVLISAAFWVFVFSLPVVYLPVVKCETGVPRYLQAFHAGLSLASLVVEWHLTRQTQRGLRYLAGQRWEIAFHVVLGLLGRFDTFSDMTFIMIAWDCNSWISKWAAGFFLVGVGCLQAFPSIALLLLGRRWTFAFKFNDLNMLLAATDGSRDTQ